jgi:3-dehydroquinate synthase
MSEVNKYLSSLIALCFKILLNIIFSNLIIITHYGPNYKNIKISNFLGQYWLYIYISIFFFKYIYKLLLLTDTNAKLYCLHSYKKKIPYISVLEIIVLVPGENSKKIDNCLYILKKLIKKKADKSSILINIGGGVITDIGGFSASIFKRGINFIHIPTTILSMVDASIGGKTGINLNKLKNEIGILRNPKIILLDITILKTIPISELQYGIMEMLKHGIIIDYTFWKKVKDYISHLIKINFVLKKIFFFKFNLEKLLYKSVLIKINIVSKDQKEHGLRRILNLGHTIGHGIESNFIDIYPNMIHGKSIGIGILLESWISYHDNALSKVELEEIYILLSKNYHINYYISYYIINIMQYDKKNYFSKINFSLLVKIGQSTYNKIVNLKLIKKSLKILAIC